MESKFLPHIAYDSVIFGFSGEALKILIMEYHNTGMFALPGGFVYQDEDLNTAVKRGLRERTGLDDIYLEQFYTFGDLARFQPEVMERILRANEQDFAGWEWLMDRFISVSYYALINYRDVVPQPDALSDSCDWYPVKELPELILDHSKIVAKALETLRLNLDRKLIGGNLLPEQFTMQELQTVYEAILDTKLHRSAFQRKLLASDQLIRHEKRFTGKAHKAPYLYSFKR
ncbi:MAG: NUDIX hydrolase [Saprospiraceae bacterium]|nr:NUDIX hydrolase [Saprospiraceae bacterium]